MKIWWLLFFSFPFVFTAAQTPVTPARYVGTVLTRNGNVPLQAVVMEVKSGRNILCDTSGKFMIKVPSSGKYAIKISHTGYVDLVKEIRIPDSGYFHLAERSPELEQVVVTAVAGATRIKRTPVSIAIVSQQEMNRYTATNVIEAVLKSVPGLSAITTGPNISKPFIRGLGYNRVLTLYDGIRQEGQQWGDEHGIEIDQYGIARAEVVKGPASLLYGSDAIAGVVNLIPGLPAGEEGKTGGEAIAEYHGNNGMIGASASLHYKKNGLILGGRISAKAAANYRNQVDGRVYNTGFKERNISAFLGWGKHHTKNFLQVTLYDNLQEIPDGSRDSLSRQFTRQELETDQDDIRHRPFVAAPDLFTYRTAALHQHIQHYRVYHKGNYITGTGTLATVLGFQQNNRKEYNHPTVPSQAGLNVQLNTLNYDVKYSLQEWKEMHLTFGINGMYQQNINKDATDFPIPDYRLFDIGIFAVLKKEYKNMVITGGLRYDTRNINWNEFYTQKEAISGFNKQANVPDTAGSILAFPSYHASFTGLSGSMGMVYTISGNLTLKANIARGYRSPSISETGSAGLDPGARIYYIGNRDFKPEFNWQSDLGLFLNAPDVDAGVEIFDNHLDNYIFLRKVFDASGKPLEIVPGNFTYQYQQGSARLYGAEATLTLHPKTYPWLHFQQSLSAITGINTDHESLKLAGNDAKYLPLIPPLRCTEKLRVNIRQKNKYLDELFFQAEIETYATQDRFYAVDDTETRTIGYSLVNLGGGISIMNKKDKAFCRFSIHASNLFDVAYQSHQNRLKYFEYYTNSPDGKSGIYNMGRNIAVKLAFSW